MILGLPLLSLFVRLSAFAHDGNANEAAQMPIVLRKVRLVVREVLNIFFSVQSRLSFNAGGDMHAEGAGFADQLALELGFAVDLVGVRGSGATAARINLLRRARQTPDYWSNKKLVIWCFAARELTESDGWRNVPIGS